MALSIAFAAFIHGCFSHEIRNLKDDKETIKKEITDQRGNIAVLKENLESISRRFKHVGNAYHELNVQVNKNTKDIEGILRKVSELQEGNADSKSGVIYDTTTENILQARTEQTPDSAEHQKII